MWSVKEKELKAPLQVPMGATVQISTMKILRSMATCKGLTNVNIRLHFAIGCSRIEEKTLQN